VVLIVPSNGETAVVGGCPIFADIVVMLEGSHEVDSILLVSVLDGKVVHHQGKCNWAGVVAPKAGSDGAWHVTVWFKELLELMIGQEASLGGHTCCIGSQCRHALCESGHGADSAP